MVGGGGADDCSCPSLDFQFECSCIKKYLKWWGWGQAGTSSGEKKNNGTVSIFHFEKKPVIFIYFFGGEEGRRECCRIDYRYICSKIFPSRGFCYKLPEHDKTISVYIYIQIDPHPKLNRNPKLKKINKIFKCSYKK